MKFWADLVNVFDMDVLFIMKNSWTNCNNVNLTPT